MKENVIKEKSFAFALRIDKLTKQLYKKDNEYLIGKQLFKSGTAIGALASKAEKAENKSDFIQIFTNVLKEVKETCFWIDLLYHGGYLKEKEYKSLCKDTDESLN